MKYVKTVLNALKNFLPHLLIALSLILVALVITDQFNRAMNFVNHDITKGGLLLLAILVVIQSVLQIIHNRKDK